MDSDFSEPINIGSEEMVTINQLAEMVMKVAGKKLTIKHIPGPLGVRGRNSGGWRSEDRSQRTEVRRWNTEDRGQSAGGGCARRVASSTYGARTEGKKGRHGERETGRRWELWNLVRRTPSEE